MSFDCHRLSARRKPLRGKLEVVIGETVARVHIEAEALSEARGIHHSAQRALAGSIVAISEMSELNLGHNIVARAVLVGMERAVREMLEAMRG